MQYAYLCSSIFRREQKSYTKTIKIKTHAHRNDYGIIHNANATMSAPKDLSTKLFKAPNKN